MFLRHFRNFLKIKIFYKRPSKYNIAIFDEVGSYYIKLLLKKKNFFIINSRLENNFKLNLFIVFNFFFLKNIFKYKLKINYYLSLINIIKPKIILTFIDNSEEFFELAKLLYKKIFFLAIQNATRFMDKNNKLSVTSRVFRTINIKKAFIPNYACFSKNDICNLKKKISVFNYYDVGSLKFALFKKYFNKKKSIKYDICLIAEDFTGYDDLLNSEGIIKKSNFKIAYEKIVRHVCKLSKEKKLQVVIISKHEESSKLFMKESQFYEKFINYNHNIKFVPNNIKNFSNYNKIFKSKLLIGGNSTLLYEFLNYKKILACNFLLKKNWHSFSYKKKICYLENSSYKTFKKKVIQTLNMSHKNYFKNLGKEKNRYFFMSPASKTLSYIENIINDHAH
jgi:surface carbohydrate biosynthesis protein